MNQWLEAVEGRGQGEPLCRRYLVVFFEAHRIQIREPAVARDQTMRWALGMLADEQRELLGVWPDPVSGSTAWQAIHSDLTIRGVERIRYVVFPGFADLNASYPGATLLNSVASLLPLGGHFERARDGGAAIDALAETSIPGRAQAVAMVDQRASASHRSGVAPAALSQRQRQVIARVDQSARQLQAGLGRALRRHGGFDSREAAVAFLDRALQRLARDVAARSSASARAPAIRSAGVAAVAGIRAIGA